MATKCEDLGDIPFDVFVDEALKWEEWLERAKVFGDKVTACRVMLFRAVALLLGHGQYGY